MIINENKFARNAQRTEDAKNTVKLMDNLKEAISFFLKLNPDADKSSIVLTAVMSLVCEVVLKIYIEFPDDNKGRIMKNVRDIFDGYMDDIENYKTK